MSKLPDILKQISHNPLDSLRDKILLRIDREVRAKERKRALFGLVSALFSGILLIVALVSVGESLLQSEFWTILSLLFSDISIIASSFQDFGYSLLETLPIVPIVGVLLPLFLLNISLSFWSSHSKTENPKVFPGTMYAH